MSLVSDVIVAGRLRVVGDWAHGATPDPILWAPTLGPTATLAVQRLMAILHTTPDAVIDVPAFAASLGVGRGLGDNAPLVKALDRLVRYRVARVEHGGLTVRMAWPDTPESRRTVGQVVVA